MVEQTGTSLVSAMSWTMRAIVCRGSYRHAVCYTAAELNPLAWQLLLHDILRDVDFASALSLPRGTPVRRWKPDNIHEQEVIAHSSQRMALLMLDLESRKWKWMEETRCCWSNEFKVQQPEAFTALLFG